MSICRVVWLPGHLGMDEIQEVRREIPLKFFMKVTQVKYEDKDRILCTCSVDQYRLDQMTGRIPQQR